VAEQRSCTCTATLRFLEMYPAIRARSVSSSQEIISPSLRRWLWPLRAFTTHAASPEPSTVHSIVSSKSPVKPAEHSIKQNDPPKPQLSVRYPYFVRRTKNGNLPVYTDTKGNGYSDIVHIRRVEGDIHKLKDDLLASLLPPDTGKEELERLRERFIMNNRTSISLVGGRWRTQVVKWLMARGF